jgi:hypothetical protein
MNGSYGVTPTCRNWSVNRSVHSAAHMRKVAREMKETQFPGFDACMRMMRRASPQLQEDGFHYLLPYAADYVQQLIAEFNVERDHGLRCWLLDLIGQSRSPEAFQFLVENLRNDDERFRSLAVEGLRRLNTKEARRVLWEAGQ